MRCLSVPLLTILGAVAQSSGADDSTKPPAVSAAFTKARVEAGEGVPFFDERFSCREDGGAWSAFRELVEYARLRVFEGDEGEVLARQLAFLLADRTTNMTEVLQCNVGVIAGYHLLARRYVAAGDNWKAYRLLQLALIYVFTLRNALQVPPDLAHDWATRTDLIVEEIKVLKVRLGQEQQRRLARLPEVSPNFRVPGLRVAVVSICAYPEDHPLVLRVITPENRRLYAEKHGYGLHVHMKHPMPDTGVHIQHAKLQLVADYLRSGEYDWVAWMDCDSIIMNLNYTLDSIIHRYARRSARSGGTVPSKDKGKKTKKVDVDSIGGESAEPLEDEVLEAFVSHVGSCNSDEGCRMSAQVRVNPRTSYAVSIRAAQIDMESDSERLASVTVGGLELGECNPKPESDYDCRLHSCFSGIEVPKEAIATGIVELQAISWSCCCVCCCCGCSCCGCCCGCCCCGCCFGC
ncbi:unnamed protein product [Polarella glacialis]|uniref:Uncharacterized protein n=1 Tax=Polarella glacialis TaxID=89957 RepID=A0A813GQH3_POLGL|nr:unnamed protein product [Polarella glacialis]